MKHTFLGPVYRVQVRILDVPGYPPLYSLYVLRLNERASVSFTGSGDRVYYGEDRGRALSALVERVPDAERQMPPKMRPFFGLPPR